MSDRDCFAITCNLGGLRSGHRLDIFNPKVKRQTRKFNACQVLRERHLSPVFFFEHFSTREGEYARINSGTGVKLSRKLRFGRVSAVFVNMFSNDLRRERFSYHQFELWDLEENLTSRLQQ